MHQVFYIDIDEEISSVIDRLNKSMSGDNYFVIPKHAIFLQSVVNMKLLKREASKVGKRVIIITQDESGASMAERSGIEVYPTLESVGLDQKEQEKSASDEDIEFIEDSEEMAENPADLEIANSRNRLGRIGSEDFYSSADEVIKNTSNTIRLKPAVPPRPNTESIRRKNTEILSAESLYAKTNRNFDLKNNPSKAPENISYEKTFPRGASAGKKLDPGKEKTLERMFSKPKEDIEKPKVNRSYSQEAVVKERGLWKILLGFTLVCLVIFACVAAYLFLPKAKIILVPKIAKNKMDVDFSSSDSLKGDEIKISARIIEKEESASFDYDVAGKNQKSGKKASGSVVIYNEFSSSAQQLVVNTRLETEDGKIFRITKGITVPGTTKAGNEIKPGAVEVEVLADQTGEDYNIEPSKFTIPGFKDGPKYEKFYAKSTVAMSGGSSEGDESSESSEASAITQTDIANAKEKTEAALKDKVEEMVKKELAEGEIYLPQAQKITIKKSESSLKVGKIAKSFEYSAEASVIAIIFSEDDIRKAVEEKMKAKKQQIESKLEITKMEYATVEPDFENKFIKMKVRSETSETPIINIGEIKSELLGKNAEQVKDIMKNHNSIVDNISIEIQPSFISSIPQMGQRVSVEVVNE